MEYSPITPPKPKVEKRRAIGLGLTLLLVFGNLLLGLFGGVAGFAILANSNSTFISNLRNRLGVTANTTVALPLKQNIQIEESSAVIDASKKVMPAVVSISANQQVTNFFGQTSTQETSGGTGFILTSDGLIVTNRHVVDAAAQYKVILNDGRIFDATVKAKDTINDLAIVKIEAKDLPVVELGSSSALQVGQYVLAVGNALGEFKNTVTLGVVSAMQRSLTASDAGSASNGEDLTNLIQTDAAINPGNSGGPMVNLAGQVVGINTAIATTTGGSVGLGFAIPIDSIKNVLNSVLKTGQIIRPYLGVRYVQITKELQSLDNLSVDYGALIGPGQTAAEPAIVPGSPAETAGLKSGDIILEVNGEKVNETNTLANRIAQYNVGDTVTMKVLRDKNQIELKATFIQMPTAN